MYYQYFKVAIVTVYDGPSIKFLKFLPQQIFLSSFVEKK